MTAYQTTKTFNGRYSLLLINGEQTSDFYELSWLLLTESPESATVNDRLRGTHVPITYPDCSQTWMSVLEPLAHELARTRLIEAISEVPQQPFLHEEPEFVELNNWPARVYALSMRGSERIIGAIEAFKNRLPRDSSEREFIQECIEFRTRQDGPYSDRPAIMTDAEFKLA